MPSSRGPSQPRDQIHGSYVSCTGKQVLYLYGHLLSKTANDSGPKSMFETTSNLPKFWVKVKAEYPGIVTNALKSLLPLPTSYLCEAGFSAVTTRKMRLSVTVSHYPQMVTSNCRKTSSGLPLILCYGELYTYFIISHNVIIIEIKCTINVTHLNHPEIIPHQLLPQVQGNTVSHKNQSLVSKKLGTTDLACWYFLFNCPQTHKQYILTSGSCLDIRIWLCGLSFIWYRTASIRPFRWPLGIISSPRNQ